MDPNLFEASLTGNVQVLNALLQEDDLALDRIPLSCFNESPLHIAAMRGHIDFVKILLRKKPMLATSIDSLRRTPLHLASAEGHVEIVLELLQVMTPNGWRFGDQDGRTPLHLAAMNEQLEVIKVLIETGPDLCREVDEEGETVLHTCISFNRFEAMKLLSQLWNEDELAKLTDRHGNTLLHLAVVQKQIQTVKYLLQKSSIGDSGNITNEHGLTALDILDHCPQDLGTLQIRSLLSEANIPRAKDLSTPPFRRSERSIESNGDWLEKQRGILILAVIVVAATSFYSGLHPPGGTFSGSGDGPLGNAVQTEVDMDDFSDFVLHNTIIMVVSLMILVMLLSGIPLGSKFCLWVLNLATLCIVVFVTYTYLGEIANMSPDTWVNPTTIIMCFAWILLCLVFAVIHTMFFVIWLVKKVLKAITKTRNNDLVGV